ncbi:MAG: hypothetical protein ACHP7K_07675, partial [Actinomycetales bacterium]
MDGKQRLVRLPGLVEAPGTGSPGASAGRAAESSEPVPATPATSGSPLGSPESVTPAPVLASATEPSPTRPAIVAAKPAGATPAAPAAAAGPVAVVRGFIAALAMPGPVPDDAAIIAELRALEDLKSAAAARQVRITAAFDA